MDHRSPSGLVGLIDPALTAVAVGLLLAVAAIGVVRVVRDRRAFATGAAVALVLWVAATAELTLRPGHAGRLNLVPFDFGSGATAYEPVSNILLFAPLGILLSSLGRRGLAVVGLGLGVSLAIETTQFMLNNGRTADIDDVLENTLGALIGWLVVLAIARLRRTDAASSP